MTTLDHERPRRSHRWQSPAAAFRESSARLRAALQAASEIPVEVVAAEPHPALQPHAAQDVAAVVRIRPATVDDFLAWLELFSRRWCWDCTARLEVDLGPIAPLTQAQKRKRRRACRWAFWAFVEIVALTDAARQLLPSAWTPETVGPIDWAATLRVRNASPATGGAS